MDITGKLFAQLEEQTGQGKNGLWKKRNFVIETGDKYPKKVCLTAWGEQADQVAGLKPGLDVKVSFDLESREYQGKWYTDAKAWKIESNGGGAFAEPTYANTDDVLPPPPEGGDDLPF